jgi:two-component system response regulator GlrR
VDTRLIAASNKNMKEEVKQGRFREDLFYRIYVIPIELPSLRERKGDIPLLAEHTLKRIVQEAGKKIKGYTPGALQKMMYYAWPGNVRELENTVECAVALARHDLITEDLILPSEKTEEGRLRPFKEAKQGFERSYIIELMELTQGNVSQAAKLAGKYRADLYDLLKKYAIDPADFRAVKS